MWTAANFITEGRRLCAVALVNMSNNSGWSRRGKKTIIPG